MTADADDHRKHLEFIQAAIARQAENSSRLKNWCLTLAVASFVLAVQQRNFIVAAVATLVFICFGWLDAFYLRQERLFRALYTDTISGSSTVPPFSMSTAPYVSDPSCAWTCVLRSKPLVVLYGVLLTVGIILTITLALLTVYNWAIKPN